MSLVLKEIRSNQSTSQGHRRRCLLMAGSVFTIAVIIAVVIIVSSVTGNTGDACMGHLRCLPISKCTSHSNPDFIYSCGDHEEPKICCEYKAKPTTLVELSTEKKETAKPVVVDKTSTGAVVSRLDKIKLLPEVCGLTTLKDRIANGLNASIGDFPWMAILGYTDPSFFPHVQRNCGGTIISSRYILTAAHCTNTNNTLSEVTLGLLNLTATKDCEDYGLGEEPFCADDPLTIQVEKVIPHPDFDSSSIKNDIALIRLKTPITKFTEYVRPICLPIGLKVDENYLLHKNYTISGWGKTSQSHWGGSTILQYATVAAFKMSTCQDTIQKKVQPIDESQFCAAGKNFTEACRGDSGGPLSYNYIKGSDVHAIQLGIVSFKSYDTCGTEETPTVFVRVSAYLDWILDNLEP